MNDLLVKIEQADRGEIDAITYFSNISICDLLEDIVFTDVEIDYLSERFYKYPYSTWFLGCLYLYGFYGLEKDYEKALNALNYSVENGCVRAISSLGYVYQTGLGVHVDYAKALELYMRASNCGNVNATYNLGYMYEKGFGVPIDYAKAIEFYTRASNNGSVDATNTLGYIYCNGLGVPIDYAKAVELYTRASNSDNVMATNNLGSMYQKGLGVPVNYVKAIELYKKASSSGNELATNNLTILEKNGLGKRNDNEIIETCTICTEEVDHLSNDTSILSCMHEFHQNCINQWLKIKNNCPTCRKTI